MDQEDPIVSVIVPCYRHARYIDERMRSILSQDFQDYELILLDDASDDGSQDILKAYATEPKLSHLILNETNSGSPFSQWQRGLSLAKGRYVWMAESDDACESGFISSCLSRMLQDESIVLSYAQSLIIGPEGEHIRDNKQWTDDLDEGQWAQDFQMDGKGFLQRFQHRKNVIPNASGVIFKREPALPLIEHCQPYRMCGDWLFWSLLCSIGDVYFHARPLNHFRASTQSTRHHSDMDKKRLRLSEELRYLNALSSLGLLEPEALENRYKEVIQRWQDIHQGWHILTPDYRSILDEQPIITSWLQLVQDRFA